MTTEAEEDKSEVGIGVLVEDELYVERDPEESAHQAVVLVEVHQEDAPFE